MIDLSLRPGSRTFIVGGSGSGKTTLALALAVSCPSPFVVLDTKYDPGIGKWAKQNKIPVLNTMPDWRVVNSDIVVRPPADWLASPIDIDWWLGRAFSSRFIPSIYIDEGYQAGAGSGRVGEGVAGLWTRGRAFGMRLLLGAQRPAWISRFVLTESDMMLVGRLRHEADRKTIYSATGAKESLTERAPREFLIIDASGSERLMRPLNVRDLPVFDRIARLNTRRRMKRGL